MFAKFFDHRTISALDKILEVHTFLSKRKVIGTALVANLSKDNLNSLREIDPTKEYALPHYDHFLQTFIRSYAKSIIHIVHPSR